MANENELEQTDFTKGENTAVGSNPDAGGAVVADASKGNWIQQTQEAGPVDPTKDGALTNTGSGSDAAKDTSYSWDKKAAERADLSYKTDVLTAKQDALAKRQEIETQAQQYQTQSDMQKYVTNQSIEKAGWAGGYVLDANRQRQYLEMSIQASMYNSMELQKYGYDSQLQAARLAYDANMMDLAMEYYNTAVQNALQEGSVTGIYMSAEQKDMLSQYNTAQAILANQDASEDERVKAEKISSQINTWFEEQGISAAGVKTLSTLEYEINKTQVLSSIYEAALSRIDENGQSDYVFITGVEDGKATTIDFNNASGVAIADYLNNGGDQAITNLKTYIDYVLGNNITDYITMLNGDAPSTETLLQFLDKKGELKEFASKLKAQDVNLSEFLSDYLNEDGTFSTTMPGQEGRYDFKITYDFDKNEFVCDVNDKNPTGVTDNTVSDGAWGGKGTYGVLASDVMKIDTSMVNWWFKPSYDDIKKGEADSFVVRGNIDGSDSEGYWVKTDGTLYSNEQNTAVYAPFLFFNGTYININR